ncbi:hypothetical protein IQ07DRAFT_604601 [Pyrenochaeta sp. DS3sAY3a]|nr:hypothetical protein IQ07DRAFT_604601 [Pyrenochaeta sp. DS3sAY3a]
MGELASDVDPRSVISLSDYGSDVDFDDVDEDTILANVLDTIRKKANFGDVNQLILNEAEDRRDGNHHEDADNPAQSSTMVAVATRKRKNPKVDVQTHEQSTFIYQPGAMEVDRNKTLRHSFSVSLEEQKSSKGDLTSRRGFESAQVQPPTDPVRGSSGHDRDDVISPLKRFRTKPRKPLSVTDLVSPAWCELQYSYILYKFGRKPRTKAMQTGSRIHQRLEDEVHTTVPVQVQTKEDRFGLRIWNTISGLRCLRQTGLTRELEVWGIVDDQVVNGVIDELSYQCPDAAFEGSTRNPKARNGGTREIMPSDQPSILEALQTAERVPGPRIYITDVKTRSVHSTPSGASLRPTWMQLMLYRKLLEDLSMNTVDAEIIFRRYDLMPLENFTDVFMQEVGGICPDNETTKFPNLLSLWSLLITEMQNVLPAASISPILRAEFRFAATGDVIGSELTMYESEIIDQYIATVMAWWTGERDAQGVDIEEAFKCRMCDFADECSWRKTKVEEAIEKSRLRRHKRVPSAV